MPLILEPVRMHRRIGHNQSGHSPTIRVNTQYAGSLIDYIIQASGAGQRYPSDD